MPALLANAFSPPDAAKLRLLEEMKPCFLEGSRGTGKTMLLLSLRARILAARAGASKTVGQLFGFYIRLDRGAFCNAGIRDSSNTLFKDMAPNVWAQLADVFAQEFYLTLHESLISEISHCVRAQRVLLDAASESQLVKNFLAVLYGESNQTISHLDALLRHFADMHRRLSEFVRRRFIYQEQVSVPFTCFDLTLFKRILAVVKESIPALAQSQMTVLLDEYENLFPYQKLVINGLIKLGPPVFSVKIARKVGTEETSGTTEGQELQETHDYNRIPLIYSVDDDADFSRYLALLENIVIRLLRSQNLSLSSLASLLPTDDRPEAESDDIRKVVLTLLDFSIEKFNALSSQEQAAKLTYYREAAIYRPLYGVPGRRTDKRFSGQRDLAFISSGVIRFFQEILGMAYHLQMSSGASSGLVIAPEYQSRAVHTVSNHNLSTLSRNIETYGEQLKYFLLDLGDCLRYRLLRHTSEPESARLAIKDPQLLLTDKFARLDFFLNLGVKEGVFQTVSGRPGIRPKHLDDPQPVEFNVARIFAPALQISPRLRWPTSVSCSDLLGLLDGEQRRRTKSALLKKMVKIEKSSVDESSPSLFEGQS